MKGLREKAACERSNDGGEERGEFDDAVAPAESRERKEFGEEAVFGRAENCSLSAGKEERDAGDVEAVGSESERRKGHDAKLKELGVNGDAAFAVLIGEIAARNREKEKGNGEEQRDDQNEPKIALLFGQRLI